MKLSLSNKHAGMLLGFIGVVIFGATLPVTKIAVTLFDPWFVTFGRALMGGIIALVILISLRKAIPYTHMWQILLAASLVIVGFPGFMGVAMLTVPAVHGGLVLGILPLATAFFAALIGNERPSFMFWVWGVLGALLVTIFALYDNGTSLGNFGFVLGDFWLLLAALCAALGYVVLARISRFMAGWEAISWTIIVALPLSLVGSIVFWDAKYINASTEQFLAFSYLGIFSAYLGFFAWNSGLKLGGMARVGQVQLLQTFITFGFAALLLGENVPLGALGFALAVLVVIVLGQRSRIENV